MNPTSTKNHKEIPVRSITEVKENSYEQIGSSPRLKFLTGSNIRANSSGYTIRGGRFMA